MRSRNTGASAPTTSILPSVEASIIPTPVRTAAHSRRTASHIDSPSRGKYRGRFHWPTSSNTAPRSTCAACIGVRRTASNRAPRKGPASTWYGTGDHGGRALVGPCAPAPAPRSWLTTSAASVPDARPWSTAVPMVVWRLTCSTLRRPVPSAAATSATVWSDEPGYAGTTVTGICGSGIIEAVAELYLAGILTADGVLDGAAAARSPRVVADGRTFAYVLHDGAGGGGPRIAITQNDIRQVQLAKAALHAGCRLLMDRLGVDAVDRVRLAGAFGAHIDPVHALVLGMIPDSDPATVTSAGNAAGTGARIALLNRAARGEIEALVRRVEKVETAVEARFQEHFVDAMAIPHARDPYPRLERVVPLPERVPRTTGGQRPRRRRRSASGNHRSAT